MYTKQKMSYIALWEQIGFKFLKADFSLKELFFQLIWYFSNFYVFRNEPKNIKSLVNQKSSTTRLCPNVQCKKNIPERSLHDLCLEVLIVNCIELCLFWANTFHLFLFYVAHRNRQRPNFVKNYLCDVIEMREIRVGVGKKTSKIEMDPSFLWRHMDHFCHRNPF